MLEVARAAAVERRKVRAADAGKPRLHPHPSLTGQLGWVGLEQLERTDTDSVARSTDGRRDARRCETGNVPLEHECLHETLLLSPGRRVATASCRLGAPLVRPQCSIGHPRRRAIAASFASGLTATGSPAASSIGRSLVESA